MQYYSTNNKQLVADFREATIRGQAPDKGLYFPSAIPILSPSFIKALSTLTKEEIALEVIRPYTGDSISENDLMRIVTETVNFDFPLVPVTDTAYALELFHGPTMAFKDVGARFMSCCLQHFIQHENKKITVLVATSGDTGSAVANGFYGVEGINVVILYPSGKVSSIQEAQLTRLGGNVTALEVKGSFDDCQRMVKAAFADSALNKQLSLTSANSINVARWLPQQFYYFFAVQQWMHKEPPVMTVPSGNFGNICAGLLAQASGLPIAHFIAACNANDTVPQFLHHDNYNPKQTIPTISNAMDVNDPSNFVRILHLFQQQVPTLKEKLTAFSISDEETKTTIQKTLSNNNYLLDPHGAVALTALQQYQQMHPSTRGIFLETAHPVKFYDVLEPIIKQNIEIPESIQQLLKREKQSIVINADEKELQEVLCSSP